MRGCIEMVNPWAFMTKDDWARADAELPPVKYGPPHTPWMKGPVPEEVARRGREDRLSGRHYQSMRYHIALAQALTKADVEGRPLCSIPPPERDSWVCA